MDDNHGPLLVKYVEICIYVFKLEWVAETASKYNKMKADCYLQLHAGNIRVMLQP